MDAISIWFHNHNIDQTLGTLGTYIDPAQSASLLRFLVEEEDRLGTGHGQSENTHRRVREGGERITRVLAITEGLMEHGSGNAWEGAFRS
ncbi:MAG: hypothetical protein WAK55_05820 [Xanthobacteraceae bacterium]